MKKITNKGFTLIELLVVVAIIAILALVVLLALNPVEMARRSRDSRRLSDITTIRKGIDLALADGQTLTTTGANWIKFQPSTVITKIDGGSLDVSKYLSSMPLDPVNNGKADTIQTVTQTCVADNTVKKSDMYYEYKSDGSVYVLRDKLESLDNCEPVKNMPTADGYYRVGTAPGVNL
jgi:type IV pilus assembly protein PilA